MWVRDEVVVAVGWGVRERQRGRRKKLPFGGAHGLGVGMKVLWVGSLGV